MFIIQGVAYTHPNKDLLFSDINLTISKQDKIALIGNNGAGKSTLLRILAGELGPSAGVISMDSKPYYVPQIFGQYNELSVAQALGVSGKLEALGQILAGHVTEENMTLLDDDWTLEERCMEALMHWGLADIGLEQQMGTLSGGQKTKVFLAGISIHRPSIVLLDEPSNHLDLNSRELLYDYIRSTSNTLVVVSHDRMLLNLVDSVCELSNRGITVYGGNYDFYSEQKCLQQEALAQDVRSQEKALRKAKETERESLERQQKLDARGKKKQEKAGLPTISMNTFRNNAEKSTARMKGVHAEKVDSISEDLNQLRKELPDVDKMKMGFDDSSLHRGKVLLTFEEVNFGYGDRLLWKEALNLQVLSGERIAIKGANGSGKTTLIRMILGVLTPRVGVVQRAPVRAVYIDQEYSLIDDSLCVFEQAGRFNAGELQEHEIKIRLTRFLFTKEYWDKNCSALSGGEKMRLALCCLTIGEQAPDLILLDEPTNNLDIQNVAILTAAINEYRGTVIVVSHDEYFLKEIGVEREVLIT
ncbi:MAG: ABC-F family ATP-binding cassette domain-containing protein [Bacteroidetes bacterium]|nr:ABC-F family ATP-binding cassette domain-containing protein [Bacteroidota bacterium]